MTVLQYWTEEEASAHAKLYSATEMFRSVYTYKPWFLKVIAR